VRPHLLAITASMLAMVGIAAAEHSAQARVGALILLAITLLLATCGRTYELVHRAEEVAVVLAVVAIFLACLHVLRVGHL